MWRLPARIYNWLATSHAERLKIIQQAHPHPRRGRSDDALPYRVEGAFSRRVVETCSFRTAGSHRSDQLVSEKNDRVPLKQKGWQDALEAVYRSGQPFHYRRGDVVYIQDAVNPPVHLPNSTSRPITFAISRAQQRVPVQGAR